MRNLPLKIKHRLKTQITQIILLVTSCWLLVTICYAEPPRYTITAKIDTARHKISAKQTVVFTNNSDKETKEIFFHIYPHRKYTQKEIRFLYRYAGYFKIDPFPEGFQAGDLKIESVSSGGSLLSYAVEGKDETILKINLESGLGPGESREINIEFSVDIPHSYGRFGWHKSIISLVRWYPLLCVLDKDGWHNYPFYLYHQPYFSDASYYKVRLTLPQNQKVAHSGYLKAEEINPDGTKTLNIETEFPVRDFGLGLSCDFLIFSLQKEKLRINSYYLEGDFARARLAAQHALELMEFYAQRFGEYPYSTFNIVPSFLGYGGTQSSNLIFIDTRVYKLPGFLSRYFDFMIAHETGHQWFYNIIGSDEYKEMFMDEGMNSYWLLEYLEHKYGPDAKVLVLPKSLSWLIPNFSFRDSTAARYIYLAKNGLDRPVIGELSSFQEPSSIFALTYGKGAAVLDILRRYVSQDVFNKILLRYAGEFRFKNINLKDLIRISNEESGRELNLFFVQWLETKKTCDYAVKSVSKEKVVLENRGTIHMPLKARIVYQDNEQETHLWDDAQKFKVIPVGKGKKVKQVALDPDGLIVLDLDRTNNYWPTDVNIKPVPLYLALYEIPLFLKRSSYNFVFGPSLGGSYLGAGASLQKPYDNILRASVNYDFSGKAIDSLLGYEFAHVGNKQAALGFEIFDYESSKDKQDVSGGKIYLRRELWPVGYGLFDLNDHVTLYVIRDQKLEKTTRGLNGKEDINNFYYRKKDEAIFGITGSLGRYGPYSDPDYGWKFIPTQEFAGHFLGGNDAFWRTALELNNYRVILPQYQHKIATHIKFGWGEPSDKNLFQLGGPDGLRGYSRKTIQGSHMILGRLEYRLPIKSDIKFYFMDNILCLDKIQAVGFFDAARAWYADFDGQPFKKDIGIGLRLHFDAMAFLEKVVLRVDYAVALNDDSEEDPHIWFGLSQAF